MSSQKQITKAAGVIGLSTVVSRILGFVRDAVFAWLFGARMASDAFQVAFRIPNILRRLVGEGAMTAAFIPVFVEERQRSAEHAWAMTNAVITLLSVLLIGISVGGVLLTPFLIRLIAPGFHAIPEKFELTVYLTRITFPYIFFISLTALTMGILNALHHFLTPALGPAMLNLALIACALWLGPHLQTPIVGQSIGVILGGIAQLLFQTPALLKHGYRYRVSFDYHNPAVRKICLLILPAFFGLAVTQITIFINTFFASLLSEGSISYLYYADRIVEFPLGIFGIAVATAVLPTMSAQTAKGDYAQLVETLSFALRLVLFITIPSTVGLIVLRAPIVALLFERGEFTGRDTIATAQAVFCYAVGLAAFTGVRIIVPVFYAMKDTMTPVLCGVGGVGANIVLCGTPLGLLWFSQHFGVSLGATLQGILTTVFWRHWWLALATSLASYCNLLLLLWLLRRRLGPIRLGWRSILRSLTKVLLASLIMGVCCMPFAGPATHHPFVLGGLVLVSMVIFFGCAYFFESEEVLFLKTLVFERKT